LMPRTHRHGRATKSTAVNRTPEPVGNRYHVPLYPPYILHVPLYPPYILRSRFLFE
jgi:hypothetical protein